MTASQLEGIFRHAIGACHGKVLMERALGLHPLPAGTKHVLAVGKAARAMAEAVATDEIAQGLVTTRDESEIALGQIDVARAGHPIPDERSVHAAERALALAEALTASDTL